MEGEWAQGGWALGKSWALGFQKVRETGSDLGSDPLTLGFLTA